MFKLTTEAALVLVIEDQKIFSQMLTTLLQQRLGCKVLKAETLAAARELLQQHGTQIQAAVCDLHLPDASGSCIIEAVQAFGIPAIAMTGKFSEELRQELMRHGVVDYVLKDSISSFDYVQSLINRLLRNRSVKALIVDDSVSARQILQAHLRQQGIEAMLAGDGEEALSMLRSHPDISLVLTDHEMPRMSGVALTAEIRKFRKKEQLAVIGVSGNGNSKLSSQFLKHGANDFITKPFSYEELLCRVNQNLDMLDLIQSNRQAAISDFLTGLYNRRYFFEQGAYAFRQTISQMQHLHLAVIDIDHFKRINDVCGHEYGDLALRQTAKHLKEFFQKDLVGRFGGEEFVVLFCASDSQNVARRLEDFRQRQQDVPLRMPDGSEHPVQVSVGCVRREKESDLQQMIHEADTLLYQAKQTGRNRIISRF